MALTHASYVKVEQLGVHFKCHCTNASVWETEEELEIHEWSSASIPAGLKTFGEILLTAGVLHWVDTGTIKNHASQQQEWCCSLKVSWKARAGTAQARQCPLQLWAAPQHTRPISKAGWVLLTAQWSSGTVTSQIQRQTRKFKQQLRDTDDGKPRPELERAHA